MPTAVPGKAGNVAGPTRTPAPTSGGVARRTTNSEPPRFRKWWIDSTATRGGSSRTVTSRVTDETAWRMPNSTGRAAVTVRVAGPETSARLRLLAERADHPQAIRGGLLHLAGAARGIAEREHRKVLPVLSDRGGELRQHPARGVHEELQRSGLADELLGRLDLDAGTGFAAGHEPRDRGAAEADDDNQKKRASYELHPSILVPRTGRRRAPLQRGPGPAARGGAVDTTPCSLVPLTFPEGLDPAPGCVPVSSRGQDTWFSATGPGFESPYRYQLLPPLPPQQFPTTSLAPRSRRDSSCGGVAASALRLLSTGGRPGRGAGHSWPIRHAGRRVREAATGCLLDPPPRRPPRCSGVTAVRSPARFSAMRRGPTALGLTNESSRRAGRRVPSCRSGARLIRSVMPVGPEQLRNDIPKLARVLKGDRDLFTDPRSTTRGRSLPRQL